MHPKNTARIDTVSPTASTPTASTPTTGTPTTGTPTNVIALRGVRQNNLRGFDVDIGLGQITVITGVSGSGKSSLAFDTIYAEGQRRYVECLSSYARQFLERMDRPAADSITGILPTVALEQGKRLRAARSTVATLTEISEYLKVVFASSALPTCPNGHGAMARLRTGAVVDALLGRKINEIAEIKAIENKENMAAQGRRAVITFPLHVVSGAALITAELQRAGLHRRWTGKRTAPLGELREGQQIHVLIDRLRIDAKESERIFESIQEAQRRGDGEVDIWIEGVILSPETGLHVEPAEADLRADGTPDPAQLVRHRASSALRCEICDHHTADPSANLFSWNSPVGACESCNGFGRIMALDEERCLPDTRLTLAEGVIKPWSTARTTWERQQLEAFCQAAQIDMDTPWQQLDDATRGWLMAGFDPERDNAFEAAPRFYGLREWFAWLESRTYRMHVRVLLSRYRKFITCPGCDGTRLKPQALGWQLAGQTLPQWLQAPIAELKSRISGLQDEIGGGGSTETGPLAELQRRIELLHELGLGYLSLGRAGRTLSGGELQRVQLVTALSSGLSQVLYVLDEPSVGLHPRDNERLLGILSRLKAAGNTVVMVEHDPALIAAADHVIDLGPGAGERGGALLFSGPPAALKNATGSLTADYLLGRRQVAEELDGPTAKPQFDHGEALRADASGDGDASKITSEKGRKTSARNIARRARQLDRQRTLSGASQPWLSLIEPRARNLKGGRARFRRGKLNVVCGVSGSGKSTLIEETLHRALLRHLGRPADTPGAHAGLDGTAGLDDVVLVEQAAVAGNSRANPATYLKLWDGVRKRLAATDLAKERGYTASMFSFNRPGGRCTICKGAGLEVVDMQFLSDVRITCEACEGRRFGTEVLDVKVRGMSVADFLAATAQEIAERFADDRKLARPAKAMCELGLGYLRLGQPLSTLSGGESQRLKVAWHLLCQRTNNTLFLLDEPSIGLHLDDVRVLLRSLRRLVAAGNTVVVVEHHLDVIAAADHLLELGPEGGPGGGQLVFQGPPKRLAELGTTHTGRWLRQHLAGQGGGLAVSETFNTADTSDTFTATSRSKPDFAASLRDPGHVEVRGAKVHNLRNINVDLPRDGLTVITGLSGSGKSSLAFDVVFAEGQRRFLDCLSPYARQYLPPITRPDVDSLRGLPPTIAIAQRTTRGGTRSTVATLTDIQSYLRLLYARCGQVRADHHGALTVRTPAEVAAEISALPADAPLYVMVPLVRGRKGFHREVIDKAERAGRQWIHVDGSLCPVTAVPPLRRYVAHDIDDVIVVLRPEEESFGDKKKPQQHWPADALIAAITTAMNAGDGQIRLRTAASAVHSFEIDPAGKSAGRRAAGLDPLLFSFTSARGWCPTCRGSGLRAEESTKKPGRPRGKAASPKQEDPSKQDELGEDKLGEDELRKDELREDELRDGEQNQRRRIDACPACHGARLHTNALEVTIGERTIAELCHMNPHQLAEFLAAVPWSRRDSVIATPIVREVTTRCAFLLEVGLDYLGLDRSAITLSGGESQRIRLASQLGSNLRGVLYVLDEPTIGLHPADNQRLLAAFDRLIARGNGLIVVEHDEETIRRANHIVELGPGGGELGGEVLHAGPLSELLENPASPTGRMLADPSLRRSRHVVRPIPEDQTRIKLSGARRNNLMAVNAQLIRGRFNGIAGVSGSGKSTLVRDLLVGVGGPLVHGEATEITAQDQIDAITGLDGFGRIVEVDQSPIGRTPRSCPATYLGIWDRIRKQYAAQPEAKILGLKAKHFSFNVKGGRCETCQGAGVIKVAMSFLPTVFIACETCDGARYNRQTLRVKLRGATIADVLAMSVTEATQHFQYLRAVHRPLALAEQVGLGYLRIGQGSNTLSGGEAQRIKICAELAKMRRRETLYVLDEPSTGLHLADQRMLLDVLHALVDRGDTVVVIEHNLDVLREADWLIELGPGGGVHGGQIVYEGLVAGLVEGAGRTPTAVAFQTRAFRA